ncbi:MAG: phosphate signaling complex protein PhoU [Ignavibacteria bacterium]|nr:phosphate signaling complex protein PhoU [Ignavibacteria bacterium]
MQRHFDRDLDSLKENLARMGSLVDDQLDASCRSLFSGNIDLATVVIDGDAAINEMDNRIEKQCQSLLALNQPVAVDLRLLMAILKINRDLERMGDIAVNIAERTAALAPHREFVRSTRLEEMASIALIMVREALDAFINTYPPLATRVLESDDIVDTLNRNVFYRMVRAMQNDHRLIEACSHILILSRHLERLADHATNIAEDVIFLVEAKVVKHQTSIRPTGVTGE